MQNSVFVATSPAQVLCVVLDTAVCDDVISAVLDVDDVWDLKGTIGVCEDDKVAVQHQL